MNISVRVASVDDAVEVARLMTGLNDAVGPEPGEDDTPVTPRQAQQRAAAMAPHEEPLLAVAEGRAVGLLSLRIQPYLAQDTPYAEVMELFVEVPWRRRGVGRLLMERAAEMSAERGATYLVVRTWHSNEAAKAFYASVGYAPDEIAFVKHLTR